MSGRSVYGSSMFRLIKITCRWGRTLMKTVQSSLSSRFQQSSQGPTEALATCYCVLECVFFLSFSFFFFKWQKHAYYVQYPYPRRLSSGMGFGSSTSAVWVTWSLCGAQPDVRQQGEHLTAELKWGKRLDLKSTNKSPLSHFFFFLKRKQEKRKSYY